MLRLKGGTFDVMTSCLTQQMHKAILHSFAGNNVRRVVTFRMCSPQGIWQPDFDGSDLLLSICDVNTP